MNPASRLLRPFLDQSVSIRSIVAFGFVQPLRISGKDVPGALPDIGGKGAVLLRPAAEGGTTSGVGEWEAIRLAAEKSGAERPPTLRGLAGEAHALANAAQGIDLLLLPAGLLREAMTAVADDFDFRAVAVVVPQFSGEGSDGDAWKLQRNLFDRGLVCIASVDIAGCTARCFLASDAVRTVGWQDAAPRGQVTVSTLGRHGRFANQLFQYSYAKLYALRHGVTAAFPSWEGRQLFNLDDPFCEGESLERLAFAPFTDDDRQLWEREDPPIDVDLSGYFQETPACWQRHRPLLRLLFQLPVEPLQAIDTWRHRVTEGGRRTLVAIHVRRGDYRSEQLKWPWFRLVPEAWYLDWLRALWPTLRHPLLFVATDEPDAITPVFREFDTVSATFGPPADALPDHVRDFEILRRADHLAICNSSYSRMAAILAPPRQRCYVPSLQAQRFEPYEPWIDPAFWERFRDSRPAQLPVGEHPPQTVVTTMSSSASGEPDHEASIFLDVTDLVQYVVDVATLSGIQRVHGEILRNLLDIPHRPSIRVVVLAHGDDFGEIDADALREILEANSAGAFARADVLAGLRALLERAVPCTVRPRDIFLAIGAFWATRGMGRLLQTFKNARVIVGVLIHDLLPIDAPEYFDAGTTRMFVKGVIEALTHADFIFTTSEYNKASLTRLMTDREFDRVPVHLLPLAREQAHAAPGESGVSTLVEAIIETDYVLCVGTIEVRKNPTYLFHLWKMMVASGRSDIPTLLFAGRKGWLVRDFLDELAASNYLDGRIVMVHDATDVELDVLYRNCLLTMFPSFAEGWGLPVGESLAHGKICLCSATGGIPEAGGAAADYIDPYDARDGLEQLTRYLDNPDLRRSREREIVDLFAPRSWRNVADDFLMSTLALARQVQPVDGPAAIRLPPDRFLPIVSHAGAALLDGIDGALSAELICGTGWLPADASGARPTGPSATIRFRAVAPVGTSIVLVMRVAAYGGSFHLRIRSGSGAGTEASLAVGTEGVAILTCEVEAGNLVTAHLSAVATSDEGIATDACHWSLKGILYFEPKRVGAAQSQRMSRGQRVLATSGRVSPRHVDRIERLEEGSHQDRMLLASATTMDASRRARSFGEFLQSTDAWWPSEGTTRLDPPLFADDADMRTFALGRASGAHATAIGRDSIRLSRRSDVCVSTARFSEGSIVDRSGVWRGMGYLQGAPRGFASWFSDGPDGIRIDAEALAAAPRHDASFFVFYNGNLHNYYHWVVEGLLGLDILSRVMRPDSNLWIALPKSMDIAAVFDHRRTLEAVGLGGRGIVEVATDLIRVREAIWVDSDLVQTMPAPYLKDFQQRVAAQYAGLRGPGNRRLLIARRGPTRTIANLAQVQALLSRHGFETVYLEGMSMSDQILLFQSAEFIVGPHGAGLANLLFCEPGTKVIEFMPSAEFRPFFWLISEKLELVHGILFCPTTSGQGFQGSLGVDVGKLQALVRRVDATSAPIARDGRSSRPSPSAIG